MKRRVILAVCVLLSSAGCERGTSRDPGPPAAKVASKEPALRVVPVAGSVYALFGRGGNIGVSVGTDGLLIVDDQFAGEEAKIRAALDELSPGRLAFVLNTHHHRDHTGTNDFFAKEATVVAHDNVRKHLEAAGGDNVPVLTFDKSVTLAFNGERIRAFHLPTGHTDGDAIIYFETSNVVHMGDEYFKDRFPFVDLDAGGNATGLLKNIDAVLEQLPKDAAVIPGHGELATMADLITYRDMLRETIGFLRRKRKKGVSLDALVAQGLPAKWKSWGEGFIKEPKWIETVYRSLEAEVR